MTIGRVCNVLSWRSRRVLTETGEPLLNRRLVIMLLLTLGNAAAGVGRLPFGPVTALFVAAFCWTFDDRSTPRRRATTAMLAGVLTAIVVVLVFERVFLVRLP